MDNSETLIFPKYNHSECLRKTCERIFAQQVLPGEANIIDDNSSDDSVSDALFSNFVKK